MAASLSADVAIIGRNPPDIIASSRKQTKHAVVVRLVLGMCRREEASLVRKIDLI